MTCKSGIVEAAMSYTTTEITYINHMFIAPALQSCICITFFLFEKNSFKALTLHTGVVAKSLNPDPAALEHNMKLFLF
jgi:hypothetical protein